MNSRISDVKVRKHLFTEQPKHEWYKVYFTVDNERHWVMYDKPDELAAYAAFKEFINNCYPERE